MKNIALVAGGYTGEYEISIQSAEQVYDNLKNDYNLYTIIINKDEWYYDYNGTKINVDRNDLSLNIDGKTVRFYAAFIIIHGTPGENGLLQGYFDMINMPYNTCNALVSAVTFDKVTCNAVVKQMNVVNVADNVFVYKDDMPLQADEILNRISLPVFVKPSQGGSSLATFKVTREDELLPAVKEALNFHGKVIIEQYIKGREFSCGVMTVEGKVKALPVAEIVPDSDFFDYKAKYNGLSKEIVPAPIDQATTSLIQSTTEKIYKELNCKGVCRIDYILQQDTNRLFFLEVNTTPGQSKESIVPKQIRHMGKDVRWLYKTQLEAIV